MEEISQEDLMTLPQNLREKITSKFLKLKAGEEASHLQDQIAMTSHSRRKADRYLDQMLPPSGEAEEDQMGDIIIADDITIGMPAKPEPPAEAPPVNTQEVALKKSLLSPLLKFALAAGIGGTGLGAGVGIPIAISKLLDRTPVVTPQAPDTDTDTHLVPFLPARR